MDIVLKNLVGTECWIFIDDVIILSKSAREHTQRLENVLQRFDKASLHFLTGECLFAQPRIQYLYCLTTEFRLHPIR